MLQQVGSALDEDRPLRVYDHGVVALDRQSKTANSAKENGDERQAQTGPSARSRKRAAGRQGPAGGSRSAGAAPRVGGDVLRAAYEGQVAGLEKAYPTLQIYPDDAGMWLLATSSILKGLPREATFLVALPYRLAAGPRSWAFWTAAGRHRWIGPRHTNLGDGSICAFSPDEGAWSEGGDLRTLLDLYSVWSLRHLHLEKFGRWPGRQYALVRGDPRVQAYYRLREWRDDELCGCGSVNRRYSECCKPFDERLNRIEIMQLFAQQVPGGFGSRRPPQPIMDFIEGRSGRPRIADVHPLLSFPPD